MRTTLTMPDGAKLRTGTTRRYVVVRGIERPYVHYRTDDRARALRNRGGGVVYDTHTKEVVK